MTKLFQITLLHALQLYVHLGTSTMVIQIIMPYDTFVWHLRALMYHQQLLSLFHWKGGQH